ncbi:hypothetical protein Xaut_4854 (plasmid) [Xanthobacter versatilis]|uniref:Uncharacterized protein n=1 Tax=Xanthobacter autotrophicus (strain ATCC BAA-1158 / Py2) TaxID=78245 RepID=A7IPW9_XANP2|nr:hypothetical protein Xaut_4854 [Xanthobacter autotrophicus Py2]
MSLVVFPRPDPARFAPLSSADLMLACLAGQKSGLSEKMLARRLAPFLDADQSADAQSALITQGLASAEKTITLTPSGHAAARALLGADAGARRGMDGLVRQLLPACLGLDPQAGDVRLSHPEVCMGAIVAVGFGLPKELIGAPSAVRSELVWRTLMAGIGEFVGKGPFPQIEKPGVTERVILAGLAGAPAKSLPEAMGALACAAVGLKAGNLDAVRRAVVVRSLRNARPAAMPDETASRAVDAAPSHSAPDKAMHPSSPLGAGAGATEFAARVLEVAAKLTTPPFLGHVSIAQVYDAYGWEFPDAGALQSFKERLVAAASANRLQLARLDMPEHMDAILRMRSETAWGRDRAHFVVTAGG